MATFTSCAFKRNTVLAPGFFGAGKASTTLNYYFGGGAVVLQDSVRAEFSACLFADNDSAQRGGAIYVEDSNLALRTCSFTNNSAMSKGGAVFFKCSAICPTWLTGDQTEFSRNTARNGGTHSLTSPFLRAHECTAHMHVSVCTRTLVLTCAPMHTRIQVPFTSMVQV